MYIVKITFIMSYIDNNIKNANINPCEIVNFRKFAKIYTRENIHVHSNLLHFWNHYSFSLDGGGGGGGGGGGVVGTPLATDLYDIS